MNLVKSKLQVGINKDDISACHRLPLGKKKDQPRPILVRFRNRFIKDEVIRSRKKLKGQRVSVTDDITKDNINLMEQARKSGFFESVWFYNGKVHAVKKRDAKRVVLELFQNFSKL